MTDPIREHQSPEAQRAALQAADRLIARLQELVGEELAKGGDLDEAAAFYRIVEILETAPEITELRLALGEHPQRFGEESPEASLGHTG